MRSFIWLQNERKQPQLQLQLQPHLQIRINNNKISNSLQVPLLVECHIQYLANQ
jgi:hypothetical protein